MSLHLNRRLPRLIEVRTTPTPRPGALHLTRFYKSIESPFHKVDRRRKTRRLVEFVSNLPSGGRLAQGVKCVEIGRQIFNNLPADEAAAFVAHPVLGPRLRQCGALVAGIEGRSISEIFGYPDDLKFRSSMTLFAQVASEEPIFAICLQKYFRGEPDPQTLARL